MKITHCITPLLLASTLCSGQTIDLLDKGLERFEIWMGIPHATVVGLPDTTYQSRNVMRGTPMGLNADPKGVFSMIEVAGEPVLKITGEIYGGLTTLDSFENYHFTTQFKWGEKKWAPRLNRKRDSGILYHCSGEHGEFWEVWKRSLEYQVQESDLGDFIGLSGPKGLIRVEKAGGKKFRYAPNSEEKQLTSDYTDASEDPERPHGEWNTLEVYTIGQTAIHVANGVVVMVVEETQDASGAPLTSGQIQIQSEAAECYYKNMQITPITEFPSEITAQIPFL